MNRPAKRLARPIRRLALLGSALVLAACGAAHSASSHTANAAPVSTSTSTSTATASSSTTAAQPAAAADRSSGPAGGPVPRDFDPVAFSAISATDFWLLGTAPCANPACTSIVRTTDGGTHFVGIPAPPVRLTGGSPSFDGEGGQIAFADRLDGFVGAGGSDRLWVTHDGGAHWVPGLLNLIAFTVSAGEVYAITGSCVDGHCSHVALQHSRADADAWSATELPDSEGGLASITAHGRQVWVTLTPARGTPEHQTLLTSADGGAHVSRGASPCWGGLGGELQASSATTIWGICPTGMMSQAVVSHDGGRSWRTLAAGPNSPGAQLVNSAQIGGASDADAVLSTGQGTQLLRTFDGAGDFQTVVPASSGGQHWTWLGFTDPQTGSGLLSGAGALVGPDHISPTQLWRSSDGGQSWRRVSIG